MYFQLIANNQPLLNHQFIDLQHGLIQELDKIENSRSTRVERCQTKIRVCQEFMQQLKDTFLFHNLNEEETIDFFKHIKPSVFSESLFQSELFSFVKSLPVGSAKVKRKHINYWLDTFSSRILKYGDFYHYVKSAATHLDHLYFLPGLFDPKIHSHLILPWDTDFSSPGEPTLTHLLAAERMIQFLRRELLSLDNPNLEPSWGISRNLSWKGSKTDLVELIYALYAADIVQNDIKDIISIFEKMFGIQLGNFYRIYTDIKLKKEPTSLINKLKISLLGKIRSEN